MSELRVTNLKHAAAAADNITLDANGNVGLNNNNALKFKNSAGTYQPVVQWDTGDNIHIGDVSNSTNSILKLFAGSGNGQTLFYGNNIERMRIDSAGRVTMPYQPAFKAHVVGSPTMVNSGNIPFSAVSLNTGSYYNTSNQTFTAPVAGTYVFGGMFRVEGSASFVHLSTSVNGSNGAQNGELPGLSTGNGSGFTAAPFVYLRYLSAGDSLVITGHFEGTSTRNVNSQSFLYGYLQS